MTSKNSKTPLNILIYNYVFLINSIYFQFWYIKDKLIKYLIHASKCVINFEFSLQMKQERIKFGKFTLPMFPKSNLSFQIHKDIKGLNKSQKCILDNFWNAKSDIQKFEVLNALSFHFKQLNDNLDNFFNLSSFDMHCTPMDTNLERFNCRKIYEESKAAFLKWISKTFLWKPRISKISIFIFSNKRIWIFPKTLDI